MPSLKPITSQPAFHWFGYYDKHQFDPTGRFVLGNRVPFEHRSPGPEDTIEVGLIDLKDNNRWTRLGETHAWNWQQGCMLQWLPGSETEVFWNERDGDRFVCRVHDVQSGKSRVLDRAVYAVSPDGRWGIAPDFRRLNDCRPGYGYAGIPDPNRSVPAPDDAGIWKIDMKSGESVLLFTFAEIVAIPFDGDQESYLRSIHWFNHLLFNTDGTRFLWLHRWRDPKAVPQNGKPAPYTTRMLTAAADGSDRFVLDPHGKTSHFIWRDPEHVCAWAWHPSHGQKFYLFRDKTRDVEPVGQDVMTVNGHNTYLPGTDNDWILNDTHPDKNDLQHVYLYQVSTGRRVPLASVESKPPYRGEFRCDTHPRSNRDGSMVCIDGAHNGARQMYLIDLGGVI